ncbi:hypothetical protein J6590_033953 [Homalodisca vitripennis]|nr:hypothetical protein J6590_033953 [Homalodisca vitripennis]
MFVYFAYKQLVDFMKAQGALINHVEPKYLMSYDDYCVYSQSSDKKEECNNELLSIGVFKCVTTQCWLDLFLQIYRTLILGPTVGMKVGMLDQEAAVSEVPHKTKGGKPEDVLMSWLTHHYNTQRLIVWPDKDVLMRWLIHHYNTQRLIVWPDKVTTYALLCERPCDSCGVTPDQVWETRECADELADSSLQHSATYKDVLMSWLTHHYNTQRLIVWPDKVTTYSLLCARPCDSCGVTQDQVWETGGCADELADSSLQHSATLVWPDKVTTYSLLCARPCDSCGVTQDQVWETGGCADELADSSLQHSATLVWPDKTGGCADELADSSLQHSATLVWPDKVTTYSLLCARPCDSCGVTQDQVWETGGCADELADSSLQHSATLVWPDKVTTYTLLCARPLWLLCYSADNN